jgi:hypothetical protein
MPSQTAAPPQQGQAAPGSHFSIPPFTDEIEQPDNNDQLTMTPSSSAQTPLNGVVPFMQSDVIYGWVMEGTFTHTETDGSSTITVSPYNPWIVLGPILLNMQYQYPSISVATGYDLALVNHFRPLVVANRGVAFGGRIIQEVGAAGPGGQASPSAGQNASQANQNFTLALHTTGAAQSPTANWELPAACWFDSYYELDETGMPLSGPHQGFVSPQNMGGYARVVTPGIRHNQYVSVSAVNTGGFDQALYSAPSGTGATTVMTTTFGYSRIGVLGSLDQSVLPQPTNWQYNIAHQQVGLAGLSKANIPLNSIFAGQIMSIVVRLFDPAAGQGGSAIPVANVVNYQLQYGGSVQRWSGGGLVATSVRRLQRRFYEQHMYLPSEGILILDLAMDRNLNITNSYCLNTLRTAAVQLNLQFTGAQSASAYAEVTVEGLRWVPLPVNPSQ